MALRPKNRRKLEERRWRLPAIDWRRLAAATASVAVLGGAALGVAWALDQPIETITVEGRFQRVSPLDVEQAVKQRVRGVGLVGVDLEAVGRGLHGIAWVESASVQRAWPRGLRVLVTEQSAAARWGANGLLNARGELFISEARHIPPELPKLSGPAGSEHDVAARYLAVRGRLMEAGMHLTAMRLDERGAWEFDLDNGVTVRLGQRDVDPVGAAGDDVGAEEVGRQPPQHVQQDGRLLVEVGVELHPPLLQQNAAEVVERIERIAREIPFHGTLLVNWRR